MAATTIAARTGGAPVPLSPAVQKPRHDFGQRADDDDADDQDGNRHRHGLVLRPVLFAAFPLGIAVAEEVAVDAHLHLQENRIERHHGDDREGRIQWCHFAAGTNSGTTIEIPIAVRIMTL